MNQERPLIKLYRTRTFSEKMSDTFDFVRENWRTMLKFLTYVMAGMIFAIAGQVLMGRFSTVQYDSADSYQMRVIIVCVR